MWRNWKISECEAPVWLFYLHGQHFLRLKCLIFFFKQVKSNEVQNKSVQYFPLTHDSNPLSAHYRECSDNLKKPRPQGLIYLYVTSPGLFFFLFPPLLRLYWPARPEIQQLHQAPFMDWPESCHSIVIAHAATTLLRHNLNCCFRRPERRPCVLKTIQDHWEQSDDKTQQIALISGWFGVNVQAIYFACNGASPRRARSERPRYRR